MAKQMAKKNVLYQQIRNGELDPSELEKSVPTNALKSTASSRLNSDRVKFNQRGKPSKAQLDLIEQYKIDNKVDLVNNTFDNIIVESIDKIKESIDNLIKYKDTNVFKVIPREVDQKVKSYGMCAQEYFGKKVKELDGIEVYIIPNSYKQCSRCGDFKPQRDFYASKSDMYNGYMPLCKNCVNELFNEKFKEIKDIKETLVVMCQKLDILVYEPILKKYIDLYKTPEGKEDFVKGSFFGNFYCDTMVWINGINLEKTNSMFANSNLSGVPFKNLAYTFEMPAIYDDKFVSVEEENNSELSATERRDLKAKWGNFEDHNLIYLENSFNKWLEDYDIKGQGQISIVKQICLEEVQINIGRETELDVSKNVKTWRELMATGNLTPKKAETKSEKYTSFGELIKLRETKKPIIVDNPKFKDVDNLAEIAYTISGAMARTLSKENELVKDFYKKYNKYSANVLSGGNNDGN